MLTAQDITLISHLQLFSGTTEAEVQIMLHCLQPNISTYAKGDYIWRAGDSISSLGIVLQGNILIVHDDFWGNCNIVASITQGMSFGESFACSSKGSSINSVLAQTDCTIMFLDARRVLTTCSAACSHHNRIIRNLVTDLANKNLHFNQKMRLLSERSTRAKLLSYLSQEALRAGSPTFTIAFTRQQLADYLSVERSGLSVELRKLQQEGLLECHKNTFTLHG